MTECELCGSRGSRRELQLKWGLCRRCCNKPWRAAAFTISCESCSAPIVGKAQASPLYFRMRLDLLEGAAVFVKDGMVHAVCKSCAAKLNVQVNVHGRFIPLSAWRGEHDQ